MLPAEFAAVVKVQLPATGHWSLTFNISPTLQLFGVFVCTSPRSLVPLLTMSLTLNTRISHFNQPAFELSSSTDWRNCYYPRCISQK